MFSLGALVPLGDLGRVHIAFVAQLFRNLVKMDQSALLALLLGCLLAYARGHFIVAAATLVSWFLALLEFSHRLDECDEGRGQVFI